MGWGGLAFPKEKQPVLLQLPPNWDFDPFSLLSHEALMLHCAGPVPAAGPVVGQVQDLLPPWVTQPGAVPWEGLPLFLLFLSNGTGPSFTTTP